MILGGCALTPHRSEVPTWPQALERLLPTEILLLGERHDAPQHQDMQRQTVQWLAQRGLLAALVMEMAEAGRSTQGLAPQASEAEVQTALGWSEALWPWQNYGPVAMAAVRAGQIVWGGNLPRAQMAAAMKEAALDAHLPQEDWTRQQEAVRTGHCQLLPEGQIIPMARVQLARDRSMAQALETALKKAQEGARAQSPERTVVLVAGNAHVQRSLGVPTWLPAGSGMKLAIAQAGQAQAAIEKEADHIELTPAIAPLDHCAELRERWSQPPRAGQ